MSKDIEALIERLRNPVITVTQVDGVAVPSMYDYEMLLDEAASELSSLREENERLRKERDEAKGKLALIVDRIVYSDSYGVPGSDFACCHLCNGGGAPGVPFEHDAHCPVLNAERDYEQWFDDIRATESALFETEAALSASQAQLKIYSETIEFVRRWAIDKEGNGTSAEERLSAIAHHPGVARSFLSQNQEQSE